MKYLKCIEKFVTGKAVFCGIDVHKHHWDLCFFSDGDVVERIKIPSEVERLASHTSRPVGFNLFTRPVFLVFTCTVVWLNWGMVA